MSDSNNLGAPQTDAQKKLFEDFLPQNRIAATLPHIYLSVREWTDILAIVAELSELQRSLGGRALSDCLIQGDALRDALARAERLTHYLESKNEGRER